MQLRFKKQKIRQDNEARENLDKILMIHPDKRSVEDEFRLSQLLMDFPCFQYVAEHDYQDLRALSREIYMSCLLRDTEVFRQGDEPDCAYVMVQGTASVWVTLTYKKF